MYSVEVALATVSRGGVVAFPDFSSAFLAVSDSAGGKRGSQYRFLQGFSFASPTCKSNRGVSVLFLIAFKASFLLSK